MTTQKPRKRHSRPVDLDKMRRLAASGLLSYRSIARECDCTVGYVSQRLSGWYDAQRAGHAGMVTTPSGDAASTRKAENRGRDAG
jgi:hypothetical protein